MPSVSPRRTVSETSSTACTSDLPRANTPCWTWKRFVRCSSSTRLSADPNSASATGGSAGAPLGVLTLRPLLRPHAATQFDLLLPRQVAGVGMRLGHGRDERRTLGRARLERGTRSADGTGSRSAGASSDGGEPSIGTSERQAALDRRHRVEQPPRVRVLRLREDLRGRPVLHDPARVHHHHRVRGLGDDAEVVRDEDDADVELALDLLDQLEDLRLHRHVERGRRLVGRSGSTGCARAPSRSSRAGACRPRTDAGSRARATSRSGSRRGRASRRRGSRGVILAFVRVREHRLCDLVADAVHRVQARERILEDHRDVLAADVPQLVRRQRQQVAAVELHLAGDVRPRCRFSRPMIARFETLLPEPDSPTTPSVSPRESVNVTSLTAWTTPSDVGKRTVRPRTSRRSRRVAGSRVPHSRIDERVEDVDDEVRDARPRPRRRSTTPSTSAGPA